MDTTFETAGSSATPDLDSLLQAIRNLAKGDGVTLTPLPKAWVMKISQPAPSHRGRYAGMSLAVAASGRKVVSIASGQLVNDASRYLVLHGERPYEAVVEASAADPYTALKLQLPPDLVARTLFEFTEAGQSDKKAIGKCVIVSFHRTGG